MRLDLVPLEPVLQVLQPQQIVRPIVDRDQLDPGVSGEPKLLLQLGLIE
jgi:hypothetical protein